MAGDPEQILRGTDDHSFYMTSSDSRKAVPELAPSLKFAMKSEDEKESVRSDTPDKSCTESTYSLLKLLNHPALRASTRNIERKETKRIYEFDLDYLLTKAA